MKTTTIYIILNTIGYLFMIITNAIPNIVKLNGNTVSSVSDDSPTRITPSGFTFSIWGVIYTFLGLWVVTQVVSLFAFKKQIQDQISKRVDSIGVVFFISCLANGTWIFVWGYGHLVASFFVILVILASLVFIYVKIQIQFNKRKNAEYSEVLTEMPYEETSESRWVLFIYDHTSFSLYLAWINVATIINLTIALQIWGLDSLYTKNAWAIVIFILLTIIGLILLVINSDYAYNLVFIWALIGIVSKQGKDKTLKVIGLTCIGLLSLFILISIVFKIKKKVKKKDLTTNL
ncbi:hypothetical protein M0813_06216 [Anaeramoeba flamelloides]|uniref:Tryptophan-rich sensory protein n=1 Tax=Anaeramoeba flamelloides TaxID=1746091 RepID=A0AAV7Y1Y7_9EUKA|nr:hypothetical protein M0812_30277 [Anaeramoeba flamelloides]KAJ6231116.1 hypothetical protein M0813_06216 [Anaeramoeba flamelloides]